MPSDGSDRTLPLSDAALIDALRQEFERAARTGAAPRIEAYLDRVGESVRPAAFRELLKAEVARRNARHEAIAAADYLARFPEYSDAIAAALAQNGQADTIGHASHEHRSGLHVRCPHCHNPIELVPDAELESIECGSCGSQFSLTGGDDQATRDARTLVQIGHFKLVDRLGMGAFGTVWKAQDLELDRTVAIKIPRSGQLDKQQQDFFFREARSAAQLRHPNIVPVYEVGREGDTLYIVSEFVRGVTLADRLTAGPMAAREAAELCAQIAEALHHAHEHGVIHRDLKPANIMLDADGAPHLMDFGLARREAGEITMTLDGQVLGTPAYMSPEQAQGEGHVADRRSDVYSLGVILFEILTGELPFRGNARMMIHQVIHDEPPSPRKLSTGVPRDLETLALKCLDKNPSRRFATARELADEFQRYLIGKPILSRPIGPLQRTYRWTTRHPAVAAMLGVTISTLIFGLVGVAWQWNRAESARRLADRKAQEESAARGVAQRRSAELEEERTRLRQELYVSDLLRADSLYHQGQFTRAEEVIWNATLTRPSADDRRGDWALRRLYRDRPRTAVLASAGNLLATSADGSRLAIADEIWGDVGIYDQDSASPLATCNASHGRITSLAMSADGAWVACGCEIGGVIEVWEASRKPRKLAELQSTQKVDPGLGLKAAGLLQGTNAEQMTASLTGIGRAKVRVHYLDRKHLIASDQMGLYVWYVSGIDSGKGFSRNSSDSAAEFYPHPHTDGTTGVRMPVEFDPPEVLSVAPDQRQLLTTIHPGNRLVINTIDDKGVGSQPMLRSPSGDIVVDEDAKTNATPFAGVFALDRQWSLLAGQEPDGALGLWDFKKGARLEVKNPPRLDGLEELIMTDRADILFARTGNVIRVYDLPSLDLRAQIPTLATSINDMAIRPDGSQLYVADDEGVVGVYRPLAPPPIKLLRENAPNKRGWEPLVDGISRNGPVISRKDDRTLEVWRGDGQHDDIDLSSNVLGIPVPRTFQSAAISPDGKTAVLAEQGISSNSLEVYDVATLSKLASIPIAGRGGVSDCAFSGDSQHVVVVTGSGACVIDLETREVTATVETEVYFFGAEAALTYDGQVLAVSGSARPSSEAVSPCIMQLFDTTTKHDLTFRSRRLGAIAFSPKPPLSHIWQFSLLAICDGNKVHLRHAAFGHIPVGVISVDNHWIRSVGFSSDGNWLATGHEDGTLRIWDVSQFSNIWLNGKGKPVRSGTLNGDVIRPQELTALKLDGPVHEVVFTADNSAIRYATTKSVAELRLDTFDQHIEGHRPHYVKKLARKIRDEQGAEMAESFVKRLRQTDPASADIAGEELSKPGRVLFSGGEELRQ